MDAVSMDPAESFADNWAYLKTELQWLDRVLMMAVARQRKETKEVDRIAQTKADRATSHWWKGVVFLEGNIAYDEHRQSAQPAGPAKTSYQQQLEVQIQASSRRGVVLALPALCDRLQLTPFEKNLVLMSLAPEVNRRYARLYRFLQGDDLALKTDFPTLDLVLRLLCRNDQEWRNARQRLTTGSPLIQHQLLNLLDSGDTTLNSPLKLSESLVTYLIADQPTSQDLESLLGPPALSRPALLRQTAELVNWADLVLPPSLLNGLKYLGQRVQGHSQAMQLWGVQPSQSLGAIALLSGAPGTGKTMAAAAIAHALNSPLSTVDLACIAPEDYLRLLQDIAAQSPTTLLIKSAQLWLGRVPLLPVALVHQFFAQRRQFPGVTLFNIHQKSTVPLHWQRQMDAVFALPLPQRDDRLYLWQRAFPPQVPLEADIDWQALAAQLPLSGGEITRIAQEAIAYAAAIEATKVSMEHLVYVLAQQRKQLKLRLVPQPAD